MWCELIDNLIKIKWRRIRNTRAFVAWICFCFSTARFCCRGLFFLVFLCIENEMMSLFICNRIMSWKVVFHTNIHRKFNNRFWWCIQSFCCGGYDIESSYTLTDFTFIDFMSTMIVQVDEDWEDTLVPTVWEIAVGRNSCRMQWTHWRDWVYSSFLLLLAVGTRVSSTISFVLFVNNKSSN